MKFKTTIEIVSEAENKNEAMEIVGEYLSGNIVSGVEMKCLTRPASAAYRNILAVAAISLVVSISALSAIHSKPYQGSSQNISGINAIQPPLRTYNLDKGDGKFKRQWQSKQTKEALDYIKR